MSDFELTPAAVVLVGALLLAAVAVLVVGDYRLVTRLRRDHAEVWRSLGSPSPWFTKLEHLGAVNRFLSHRKYEALPDAGLVELSGRLRVLTNLVYWLAAVTMLLLAVARLED